MRPLRALRSTTSAGRSIAGVRAGVGVGMTDLGMNERAWALADRCVARAAELRIAVHTLSSGARVLDAGVAVPGGFAAGLALAELCMGGLGHVELDVADDRRRVVARRAGVDRPSGRVLHGVAVRRVGDHTRRVLRDGLGPAARQGARRARAVREARLRRGRRARRARARGAHAADRRSGRVGRRQGGRRARRAHLRRRARRRASPAACRSWRGCSKPGCTRWTRSAST